LGNGAYYNRTVKSASVTSADTAVVRSLLDRVNRKVDGFCRSQDRERISLMEVCGTHTMAISGFGIRKAVDERLRLLSGPGCPVCVTTQEEIDAALGLAGRPDIVVLTFGDMMRVPGSYGSLEQARARGADVRVVYSCLDGLRLAEAEPGKEFVFLGIGFETTAPTVAAACRTAQESGTANFTVLPMFKLVPPALRYIAGAERVEVDGFILPGHVSTVIGTAPYLFLADEFRMPCCVVGFEAHDIVQGIWMLLEQMERGPEVAIQYRRSARPDGNPDALRLMNEVFVPCGASWRGIGRIPGSGLGFREGFRDFDAALRHGVEPGRAKKTACRCGEVMLGLIAPPDCGLFGRKCTPGNPVGPCMVSSEGACAAYYKYEQ